MGFQDQITTILNSVARDRQTLLFSATIPKQLTDFAAAGLSDYRLLRLDTEYTMPDKATLHFLLCRTTEKLAVLAMILQRYIKGKTILFCPTKQAVELLTNLLPLLQIKTVGIYG
jgi:ATP-dependent RNA helicase DDX54/DBP10